MDDQDQKPKRPKISIKDLAKDKKTEEKEAESVTGGMQSFDAQMMAKGGGKEEVQGLLWK
jgi:hypothetical protein